MVDEALLDGFAPFEELNDRARHELASRCVLLRRKAGESLWRAGDRSRGMVVVVSGAVRIYRSGTDGRRYLVHREGPGVALGEVPLFDGGPYPASAEAESAVTALLITSDALEAAIAADPRLARSLLEGLAGRVRTLVDRLAALHTVDVRGRLARRLLERAEAVGDGPFTLGDTQARLAEELGTVREVVVRHLGFLRRQGILQSERRGRYRIENRAALEALAEP
ncbi:MAG: Crp/Fnr family transcriptional regulator [Gemmatimonadota bacterium]